ncbi:transmembrane 220 family protein [Allomuricauda sp. SCSIO 65647]|uniref:transmembrane 220 family protein n=1 Tax=Allomuricauda sp. SCSIO 65647 TaxID=2908843 RepID=UPI001F343F2B|nr:transmembrane 220 family protein [Muricauda sp. SCSIO 65647]UJH66941.1 transmembrane 220 family protein [Muricauda sp. SCSIO 65647]
MKNFFKILALVFTGLFIWAAAVQHNDPDSLHWYLLYGMAALASLLFILGNLRFLWAVFLFGFYIGFAIYYWPEKFEGVTIGEGDIVNIERGREALGLGITALIMLIYAVRIRVAKSS